MVFTVRTVELLWKDSN